MAKKVPKGIKIIAIINYIIAGFYAIFAVGSLLVAPRVLSLLPERITSAEFYNTLFIGFGIYLLMVFILVLTGFYLWRGKRRAKFSELFICLVNIIFAFVFISNNYPGKSLGPLFGIFLFIFWSTIALYLLINKNAKEYLIN